MSLRLIRAADGRRTPWKNGGGETMEIVVHPPGAGLDAFDWRISTARVAADGPFSLFPGIDRTLAVLAGDGFDLTVAGERSVRLTAASAPFAFPADAECAARLVGGPVTDLNAMTRRGRFAHAVRRLDVAGPTTIDAGGGTVLVFCAAGALLAGGEALGPGDAVATEGRLDLAPCGAEGAATALVVTIHADGARPSTPGRHSL